MLEGEGNSAEASRLFKAAWEQTSDDFEKFTAAHYVARHQQSRSDKLRWDQTALGFTLNMPNESVATRGRICEPT